jgi:hypothetical protein
MQDIQPILDFLTKHVPWLGPVLVGIGSARLLLKFFSGYIQAFLTRTMASIAASEDRDDDALLAKLLTNKGYRVFSFVVDMFLSVKLPTIYSFVALQTVTQMQQEEAKAKAATNPILQPKSKNP